MVWRAIRGHSLPSPERGMRHLPALTTHRLLDLLLLIMMALGITNVFAHAFPLFNLWWIERAFEMDVLRMGRVRAVDIHPVERKPAASRK